MNTRVPPYSALPESTVRAANGVDGACRDTGGHDGSRALGFSRGFVVAAGVALLAVLIGIVTVRVRRQDLAGAGPEPQEAAPQPGTLQRQEDRAALAAAARPCRLC